MKSYSIKSVRLILNKSILKLCMFFLMNNIKKTLKFGLEFGKIYSYCNNKVKCVIIYYYTMSTVVSVSIVNEFIQYIYSISLLDKIYKCLKNISVLILLERISKFVLK